MLLSQLEGVNRAGRIPIELRLTGELNSSAVCKALHRLVARPSVTYQIRTVRRSTASHIAAQDCGFVLQENDLRQYSGTDAELQRLVVEEANRAFDLEAGPLIRGRLIRLADREHVLLITMHRIVSDTSEIHVLTRELGALYWTYTRGQDDPLPELTFQYPDCAVPSGSSWVERSFKRRAIIGSAC